MSSKEAALQIDVAKIATSVKKDLDNTRPNDGGYFETGVSPHIQIVRAPDGHYFIEWNNTRNVNGGKNPRASIRFGSQAKVDEVLDDGKLLRQAGAVVDELNKNVPKSNGAHKVKNGDSSKYFK